MLGEILDSKYRIVRLLGQGGMGSVYEAAHVETGQRVAVKLIRSDALGKSDSLVSRFQREVKAARAIESPHIAQLFDAGTDPATGAPYMVMEYLQGEDLHQLLTRVGSLAPLAALRIAAQVCLGLQKAHEARVMHRDIKPANLFLVKGEGQEIVVKILDFGIAKITGDPVQGAETTGLTRTGGVLGSPRYMSPEQARGSKSVDPRTDLWSLGVVLYRALTGQVIHESAGNMLELVMAVCTEAPTPVQELAPWILPEVAALVHGAVQIDPEARFPSAAAMLEALQPLLAGSSVVTEEMLVPLGESERLRLAPKLAMPAPKESLRSLLEAPFGGSSTQASLGDTATVPSGSTPKPVISETTAPTTLPSAQQPTALLAAGGAPLAEPPAARRTPRAVWALAMIAGIGLAGAGAAFLQSKTPRAELAPTASASAAPSGAEKTEVERSAVHARNADRMAAAREHQGDSTMVLALLREIEPGPVPRGWDELARAAGYASVAQVVLPHESGVIQATFSPDGQRIVTTSFDKMVRVWNADGTGQPLVLRGHDDIAVSAAFSPDGRRIVSGSFDKTVRVWNADGTGQPFVLLGHDARVQTVEFSPDGRHIVSASNDKTVRVWNADGTGQPLVLRGHEDVVECAAFSPDGRRIVSGSNDKTVRVWNADGTGQSLVLRGHEGMVQWASFSPDGRRIVSASNDKTVRIWNADGTGQPLVLRGHEDVVETAAFSPDGRRIVSASDDKTIRVWNADGTGQPLVLRGHDKLVRAAFSPDGRRIVSASEDQTVRVWNVDGVGQPLVLRGHDDQIQTAAFSPDGQRIVSASNDKTVRVWNADGTGQPLVLHGHDGVIASAAFSPDGQRIVSASADKTVRVWNADGTGPPLILRGHDGVVRSAAFSPDGRRLVSASNDKTVRVWNADGTGQPFVLRGHDDKVTSAAFNPDGQRIVSASIDKTVRVWNADGTGQPLILRGHDGAVWGAAFSPDGQHIVSASDDKTVRVWNADGTGQPLILRGPNNVVGVSADRPWSPGGTRIVSASDDTVRIWNADGTEEPVVLHTSSRVDSASWSPDGRRIVAALDDKTLVIWSDVEPLRDAENPKLWAATTYCMPLDVRKRLLGFSEEQSRSDLERCQRHVLSSAGAPR